ncbi:MAG: alpha/beta hydrolase [Deltaproteobacteria bacterium]|nr:alpha/beta hydrolase [Deltaproteobacteria bacterium]
MATPTPENIYQTIDSLVGFILRYAVTLAAISGLAMALIELVKGLLSWRDRFHKRRLRKWIESVPLKDLRETLGRLKERFPEDVKPAPPETDLELHRRIYDSIYGRAEAVVLVHGFNNHYGEAGNAYYGFRGEQYKRAAPGLLEPRLEKILADLFWPGDAAWWGWLDYADFLVYPAAVGTAHEAGEPLARHLKSMPNLRVVHFIGHSLGCRVVLEAIEQIRQDGGPVVGKVCLMAAAVPLEMVKTGGVLAGAIEHCAEVRVFHSDDDWVLRDTFPPGQTLAGGDEGTLPQALGLNGAVGVAGRVESFDVTDARHGDYWGHSGEPPCFIAADRIAEFFQFGSWERTIAARDAGMAPRPGSAASRDVSYSRKV